MTVDQWLYVMDLLARARQKLQDEQETEFAKDMLNFELRAKVEYRKRRAAEEQSTTEH